MRRSPFPWEVSLAEMDPTESGGVRMETKASLEAPLTSEAGMLLVGGDMQMRQEKLQRSGDLHNGEWRHLHVAL